MVEQNAVRPRWRDALMLSVLTVVLVGGLVHYGRGLESNDKPAEPSAATSAGHGGSPAPTTVPSVGPTVAPTTPGDDETAQLDSATPTDPGQPTEGKPRHGGICWDGRPTTSLRLCGLPEGARGLAWVYPSFEEDRPLCHPASPNSDNYAVVESYECFLRADGRPVTVTYDHVEDPVRVRAWLLQRIGRAGMREAKGPNGGRVFFTDARNQPARVTGAYNRFPYVASVYASSSQAASRAWKQLVKMRPEDKIRGTHKR